VQNGFAVNLSISCVYSKMIGSDYVLVCLYIDDILIFGTNLLVVNEIKKVVVFSFCNDKHGRSRCDLRD